MKKGLRIIVLLIIGLISLTGCAKKKLEKTEIFVSESKEIEINSVIDPFTLIEINNGEIISVGGSDTSVLGEKEITVKYKDKENKEKEYSFIITIVDTEPPVIVYKKELLTTVGKPIDLLSDVIVTDNSMEDIRATVVGNYDFNNAGEYVLKYVAIDSSGNMTEEEFILKVQTPPSSFSLDKQHLEIDVDGSGRVTIIATNIDVYKLKWSFSNPNIVKEPSLGFTGSNPYFRFQPYNLGTTEATVTTFDGKHKSTVTITVKIPISYASEILRLTNVERTNIGLHELSLGSTDLINAAYLRAQESAVKFSHTRPNGTDWHTALAAYNVKYRYAGENLAQGQRSANEAVIGWMNSPGHKENLLRPEYTSLGVGVHYLNGTLTWSQMFIGN